MLEVIAMASMLTDHIGIVFLPDAVVLRIVGRLAFPIYCWLLVKGMNYTKDKIKYFLRLLIIAAISQPVYMELFGTTGFNVVFTLILGFLALQLINIKLPSFVKIVSVFALILFSSVINIEYSAYGILLILIYRFADRKTAIAAHTLLNIIFTPFFSYIQMFSIIGTVIVIFYKDKNFSWEIDKKFRLFYRIFYPLHMVFLLIVKSAVTQK